MNDGPGIIFPIFMATWIILTILGFLLFYRNKDVKFKRMWFPRYMIFCGILFMIFIKFMGAPFEVYYLVVPGLTLICFLNIHFTKFCSSCGTTIYNYNWFSKMKYCSACGAELHRDEKSS